MLEPDERKRWERNLRAMLRHASDQDPEGFAEIVQLLDGAVAQLPEAAQRMRELHGYSWTEIAAPLGVTRQSARERFGRHLDAAATA